jgi:hypothetical protein
MGVRGPIVMGGVCIDTRYFMHHVLALFEVASDEDRKVDNLARAICADIVI